MAFGYIYKITNLTNGKVYIGKKEKPFFVFSYWGSGMQIKNAIKKYGVENFARKVVEWCDSMEELNSREKYWIKEYESRNPKKGYNISEGGDSISWWTGKKRSLEDRKKFSESHKGLPNPNRIKVIMDGKIIFDSLTACGKSIGVGSTCISRVCKRRRKTVHGHTVQYYEVL